RRRGLHQARPAPLGRRQPSGPGRAGLAAQQDPVAMAAVTAEQAARFAAAAAPAPPGRPARPGYARRAVLAALLGGVPLAALYCVAAQWPLWEPATAGLAAVNLLVTVSFFATGVFVAAEPGHRVTGTVLIIAALLWPL